MSSGDFWLLIIGLGVVVATAIALFWPKKKPQLQEEEELPVKKTVARGFVGPSGRRYGTDLDFDLSGGISDEDDEPVLDPGSTIMVAQAIMNPDVFSPVILPQPERREYTEPANPPVEEKPSLFDHHNAGSQVIDSATSFRSHEAGDQVVEASHSFSHHGAGSQTVETPTFTETPSTSVSESGGGSYSSSSDGGGGGGE
jgi:hypothetical protein